MLGVSARECGLYFSVIGLVVSYDLQFSKNRFYQLGIEGERARAVLLGDVCPSSPALGRSGVVVRRTVLMSLLTRAIRRGVVKERG